jgi:hypothetical protein
MNVIDKRKTYYRFDELQGGDVFRMSNNLYMKVKSYTDKHEAILLTGHSPGITVYPKNKEKVELIRNANIVITEG